MGSFGMTITGYNDVLKSLPQKTKYLFSSPFGEDAQRAGEMGDLEGLYLNAVSLNPLPESLRSLRYAGTSFPKSLST